MVWILLALILAAGEVMSLSFFLAPFAVGALLGAVVELAGLGSTVALIVFLVSSGLLFGFVRPIARRHMRTPPHDPHRHRRARRPDRGRHRDASTARRGRSSSRARSGPLARTRTAPCSRPVAACTSIEIQGATALVSDIEEKRMEAGLILLVIIAVFALLLAAKTVRIIPQARAGVVERFGRYQRTLNPGLAIVVPFVDRVGAMIDLREQVVTFKPAGVITGDNVGIQIDSVLYFTITDAKSVSYEVANPLQAIEQLTVTTLRNVIGGLTLEEALTSRDTINSQLRTVLDEATGRWGIRVNRVEVKAIDPPASIQEAMEKQMRAERDRRAAILTAEGSKQSQILNAEGEKQAAVLTAEGQRTAAILRAEGEAKAIDTVFQAIHAGDPDQGLLSYQYLQMLPKLAQGDANKIFVIPSEFSQALGNIGGALAGSRAPAAAAADTAGAMSPDLVSEAIEAYAAAHTTPPPAHLRRARARDARDAELAADADRRHRGTLPGVPRLPRPAAARAGGRHVLGLQRAVDGAGAAGSTGGSSRCEMSDEHADVAERHIPPPAKPRASRCCAGPRWRRSPRSTARSISSSSTPTSPPTSTTTRRCCRSCPSAA